MIASSYYATLYIAQEVSMDAQIGREEIKRNVSALPLIETEAPHTLITEENALAALHDFREFRSSVPGRLAQVTMAVEKEATNEFQLVEGAYQIIPQALRGLIAKSAIRGAMQLASDLGITIDEVETLERLVEDKPEDQAS